MNKLKILWVDDEIELLKPHILFLKEKGYEVKTSNNGIEGIEIINSENFDIVFLDENMPGISGLETLSSIKTSHPNLPIVMITKNEEEFAMEEAIGSSIADYLIKPVNPNQIILCLKKNLENKRIVSEKTAHAYQQDFRNIGITISSRMTTKEWMEIYKKLVYWELELEKSNDSGINEVLKMQKAEANVTFSKFYENNYIDWLNNKGGDTPIMSHTVIKEKLFPILNDDKPTFFILIDNLRWDQWKTIQPVIEESFRVINDDLFYSIIPTATQYARNAIFSGLLPTEIERKYPKYWVEEAEEGTKNQYEEELFAELLKRYGKDIKFSYNKILNLNAGKKLLDSMSNLMNNKLNVIVYNFVDMLSHARTEMEVIRELAEDESAYRSITLSWFKHSPLHEIFKFIAEKKGNIVITTDHGSVKVTNPVKVLGDKNTNTNLRYKFGKALDYNKKEVFEVRNPDDIFLPKINVSTSYVFCRENDFFAYPNNYNYYVNYYRNTFQHGGVSMEEIMIPFVYLKTK